ncbi:MAG: SdpI family protein [Nevskia sp.]|nr:SdpI family protein [Nevskia sp.]MCK9385537.1 SdpI family protein [Nevskia sp.]
MTYIGNQVVGIKGQAADDEVWLRTQRFGGRALIISGALIAITAAAGFNLGSLRTILIGMGAITMLYSWWVYRRLVLRAPPSR